MHLASMHGQVPPVEGEPPAAGQKPFGLTVGPTGGKQRGASSPPEGGGCIRVSMMSGVWVGWAGAPSSPPED